MGGGRVAPNPSNEVDIYDPGTNTWTTGDPFSNARRNFPTDTDGTTQIWLSGGYDVDGVTPLASMEIFCQGGGTPTPTPTATATGTATATQRNSNSNSNSNSHGDCHSDGNSHSHADGDTNTDAVRRKMYSDTAASSDSSASPVK